LNQAFITEEVLAGKDANDGMWKTETINNAIVIEKRRAGSLL